MNHSNDVNPLTHPNIALLPTEARAVLAFWFDKQNDPFWFVANDAFDKKIDELFSETWQAAVKGECAHWRRVATQAINQADEDTEISMINLAGRLAEILVLDQFSRNLYRGQATAFSQDNMALILAQEAVHQPHFADLPMQWRKFMILPFMHSESALIHKRYFSLFEQLSDAETLDFEYQHLAIIENFGRYPHRNAALNRESTAAEIEFLQQPNSSF